MPTLLLVDDESLFRQTASTYLRTNLQECAVLEAENGRVALDLLSRHHVDCLVTDLRMPVFDGISLLTEILNQRLRCSVVVLSAYATPEVERWALANHAFALLDKPVALEELHHVVQGLLRPYETSRIEGVSIFGLCQLFEMEKKTAEVLVTSQGRRGRLTFVDGTLTDAVWQGGDGPQAAIEVLSWPNPTVEVLGRTIPRDRTVNAPLNFLMMETVRLIDEKGRGEKPPVAEPRGMPDVAWATMDEPATRERVRALVTDQPRKTLPPSGTWTEPKGINMMNVDGTLQKISNVQGFIGASIVDTESGMSVGQLGTGLNLDVAAAANSEVVRAKHRAIEALGLDEKIDDILISLTKQYHLIRPLRSRPAFFIYLALDRSKANLAMARILLSDAEKELEF